MNENLFRKLLDHPHVPSPGDTSFVSSLDGSRNAVEVAVIHHHRFAFYYWMKWTTQRWSRSLPQNRLAPDLITIDRHNDVGGSCDCLPEELSLLVGELEVGDTEDNEKLKDAIERRRVAQNNVAAFSFLGLRALNDGHIYPAQYLNAVGNVYVLYNQGNERSSMMTDQFGHQHETHYFRSLDRLLDALQDSDNAPVYFDLDVDYFFANSKGKERGAEVMVPEKDIRALVSPNGELMSRIKEMQLQGVTLALEPTYCGGISGCFTAMSIISEELFDGSLLGHKVDWSKRMKG